MGPKKRLTREEQLQKKRERERERYRKIKEDPQKLAEQKEKERIKYANKMKKGQVKLVKDMTDREHRVEKKKWRQRSQAYYKRKTAPTTSVSITPPDSDEENPDDPTLAQQSSGRKRIKRDRSKIIQRNVRLAKENERLRKAMNMYRQRWVRAKKTTSTSTDVGENNPQLETPRSSVRKLMMKQKDKQNIEVKKKIALW